MFLRVTDTIPHGVIGGNCYLCHGAQRTLADGSRERMLDTGVSIDEWTPGTIAICESCATYMARQIGMLTPADVEELTVNLAAALDANTGLELELSRARPVLEAVESAARPPQVYVPAFGIAPVPA